MDPVLPETIRIRIQSGMLKADEREVFGNGSVIFKGNATVGRWIIGFTDPEKQPFVGNQRIFTGEGEEEFGPVRTRNSPDTYKFWVMAEKADGSGEALYIDPKLVIRAPFLPLTGEDLAGFAAELQTLTDEIAEMRDAADGLQRQLLEMSRQMP